MEKPVIVEAKIDAGFPGQHLKKHLEPLDINAVYDQKNKMWAIKKGQQYRYNGPVDNLSLKYPKGHKLEGKPAGISVLFKLSKVKEG